MPEAQFTHVAYVAAAPQAVWEAITSPELTPQFFGERFESEWAAGAAFVSRAPDGRVVTEGRVVESDPPRRLALTWERAAGKDGVLRPMPRAVAAYAIEPVGADVVRVTVTETHDEPVDPAYLAAARTGWPVLVSRLKTLLETGRPMPPFGGG
jgi:uncharacterized protein YndB with AHSA1/START domain